MGNMTIELELVDDPGIPVLKPFKAPTGVTAPSTEESKKNNFVLEITKMQRLI